MNVSRETKIVLTESLAAASFKAALASLISTPSISYKIRPGCTRAIQYSTDPFPYPFLPQSVFL